VRAGVLSPLAFGHADRTIIQMRQHKLIKQRARDLRQDGNNAERQVWRLLRDRRLGGLKFRRQHVLGKYIVDFVCLSARLVIEIDGDTHDDPEADARRTSALEEMGYRVIRFWNSYIYDPESAAADMILDALRSSALPQAEKERLDREGLIPTPLTPALSRWRGRGGG
jgi:very-short-patch-repair endonuclease